MRHFGARPARPANLLFCTYYHFSVIMKLSAPWPNHWEAGPYLLSIVACGGECGVPFNHRVLRKNLSARRDSHWLLSDCRGLHQVPGPDAQSEAMQDAGSQVSAEFSMSACLKCSDALYSGVKLVEVGGLTLRGAKRYAGTCRSDFFRLSA